MTAYADLVKSHCPVFYFPLDDAGTTVTDATGHGYSGLCAAGITVGSAPFSGSGASKLVTHAGTFPSTSTAPKITYSAPGSFPISALPHFPGRLSYEGWFRRATPGGGTPGNYTLLDVFSGAAETYFGYQGGATRLIFQVFPGIGGSRFVLASTTLDTSWHHLVATWDGSTPAVYLDAVALSFTDSGGSLSTSAPTSAVTSGAVTTGDMTAEYAHVAAYACTLTPCLVQSHYDLATTGSYTDCGRSPCCTRPFRQIHVVA